MIDALRMGHHFNVDMRDVQAKYLYFWYLLLPLNVQD